MIDVGLMDMNFADGKVNIRLHGIYKTRNPKKPSFSSAYHAVGLPSGSFHSIFCLADQEDFKRSRAIPWNQVSL